MSKESYDEAYKLESRKFPAIFRMTKVNMIILTGLLVFYVGGSFLAAFVLSEGEEVDLFFLILAVAINMAILGFAFKCLTGDVNTFMQMVIMVAIPIWAIAIFVVPGLAGLANWLFIIPLLWLEIMIIVEKIIHSRAQRTANLLDDYERERVRKQRNNF